MVSLMPKQLNPMGKGPSVLIESGKRGEKERNKI
jgi:hypothetical protein